MAGQEVQTRRAGLGCLGLAASPKEAQINTAVRRLQRAFPYQNASNFLAYRGESGIRRKEYLGE